MSVAETRYGYPGVQGARPELASDESAPTSADFSLGKAVVRKVLTDEREVPLPLIPNSSFPEDVRDPRLSRHHEFFLPGQETFTLPSAIAMRQSRILRVQRDIHNDGRKSFHRFYDESRGPETEEARFRIILLSLAGYLPREGIDLWNGFPTRRPMEDWERAILTTVNPGDGSVYKNVYPHRDEIKDYLEDVVKQQNLEDANPELISEFTSTSSLREVRDAGSEVLKEAVRQITQDHETEYRKALKEGLLHPAAPITAEMVVLKILGSPQRQERLLQSLWQRLSRIPLQKQVQMVKLTPVQN